MKKRLLTFLTILCLLLTVAFPVQAESAEMSANAQLLFDTIRWNLNLPKQSMVQHAEEYLFKLSKQITLHTLMAEVSVSEDMEMQYGAGSRIILIDLDTCEVIDYKNFDGNVRWPDTGEVTSKYDALHLLYNAYWSCLDGYNDMLMSEFAILMPLSDEDVAAINAALTEVFIRP